MWYRLTTAAYSTELGQLRNHFVEKQDPANSLHRLPEYWEDTEQDDLAEAHGDDPQGWWNTANPNQKADYNEWLRGWPEVQGDRDGNGYDTSPSSVMDYKSTLRPQWLTHFTDHPDQVAEKGFQRGHPTIDGVHLTTKNPQQRNEPGYNYAFPAGSPDAEKSQSEAEYGQHGVVFYGGGLETYHNGDDQQQIIVWGPSVNKRMIFPIHRNGDDGSWAVRDRSGRELVAGKTYQEAVKFVQVNWRMLQQARDKAERQPTPQAKVR